jgi:hypothetical protein
VVLAGHRVQPGANKAPLAFYQGADQDVVAALVSKYKILDIGKLEKGQLGHLLLILLFCSFALLLLIFSNISIFHFF